MPVKSAPYYWVECDGCGVSAEEGGDTVAWQDRGYAADSACDAGFTVSVDDTRWLCEECGPARCPECQDANPGPIEHEHMCEQCWDGGK